MRPSTVSVRIRCLAMVALLGTALAAPGAEPSKPGPFRERYPAGSIDSVEHADAALAVTVAAKARVEKEYKLEAAACTKEFLVNACLDRVRETRRSRLADITSVELDAERYKRRERADRVEADRARRDAERTEHQPASDAQRAGNRTTFEERQARATRDAADRARSDAQRAAAPKPKKAGTPPPSPAAVEADARKRAKNATDYAAKTKEAEAHRAEIARRIASKTADRKRRADEKAAKDAAAAAKLPATTVVKP